MGRFERHVYLEAVVHCCRVDDGAVAYTSEPNRMTYGETADDFSESLVMWRDHMLDFVAADLEETVDVELCQKIGGQSLKYCGQHTILSNIRAEEVEVVEEPGKVAVPKEEISELELQPVLDRIKRLESLYGTDMEPTAREQVEFLKRKYKLEYVY